DIMQAIGIGAVVASFLLNTCRGWKAIELLKELLVLLNDALVILNDSLEKDLQLAKSPYSSIFYILLGVLQYSVEKELAISYRNVFTACYRQGKYVTAKELIEEALAIDLKIGDRKGEAADYGNLGAVFQSIGQYGKAKKYQEKAVAIRIEIGDRNGEAASYVNLGNVYLSLGEYSKAKEYYEKSLSISVEIGDRKAEALSYVNLGAVFESLGDYVKAKEYLEKAHAINTEIGNRYGEAAYYANLGTAFYSHCEYNKAKEYHEKALAVSVETGNRNGEALCYGHLGAVFLSLGKYVKAKEYQEKALAIRIEIGDRNGEALSYENLGTVFYSLGECTKAKEYLEKALAIQIEIGDRIGEASSCGALGTVFYSLCEPVKAQEYQEKALAIRIEIGDRRGVALSHTNLGMVFLALGEYVKAEECDEKALAIRKEIGDRHGEALSYGNLGTASVLLGRYVKAKENFEKALAIEIEIGEKTGEVLACGNLGALCDILGEHVKAKEYLDKSLAIAKEIGHRDGEASCYQNLGSLFLSLGENVMGEELVKKALSIRGDIGDGGKALRCHYLLAMVMLSQGKMNSKTAFFHLFQSIKKFEDLRYSLADNDHLKISFSDANVLPYQQLCQLFWANGSPNEALYVVELRRARALADLMTTQYSVKMHLSANPESWFGMENIVKKESNCSCLYISYNDLCIYLWILKTSGVIHSRKITVNEDIVKNLDDFFSNGFRSFGILSEEECEDRSLNDIQTNLKSFQKQIPAASRLVEEEDEESLKAEPNLPLSYKMLIAPVADLLQDQEIIIVPDRSLYQVPFAALPDESGKYLSETFRIRIVPSLTTLKLIQDSPADYHSQTAALIVGDPKVGQVLYNGRLEGLSRLPCAGEEAEMIGRMLGVEPLLAEHATKQAVLQTIHTVSLIHFAAHGNAERGEIALAPQVTSGRIPEEKDYLLTMKDISEIQLRAKLVVLSCCHSGSGQIRAEGVVGIARAFLGSGARSVLVALWAIEDTVTKQLMSRFYEHLVRGESASECLHQAMKWMRGNGYSDVRQWAPFMLIGDNVTFDFGK
ncbi:hypothetical protein ACROYT_G001105, partial [Oculina patagonica]